MQKRQIHFLFVICLAYFTQSCGVMGLKSTQYSFPQENAPATKSPIESKKRSDNTQEATATDKGNVELLEELAITSRATVLKNTAPVFLDEGIASWYGPNFHGKLTANGEIYDMDAITAAHRTLAFNSVVKVTNLENGLSVVVRINDRGPYAKQRIIDLSRQAAKKIDMIEQGTTRVRLELIEGNIPDLGTFCSLCETFGIQLGAFSNEFDAKIEAEKLAGSYIQKTEVNGKKVYRIFFGSYSSKDEAAKELDVLRKKGFDGFVKQLDNL